LLEAVHMLAPQLDEKDIPAGLAGGKPR